MKIIYKDGHVDECPQEEELHVLRHSAAHIMAQAIKRLYPQADFAFGPATQNGFFYDVDLGDTKLAPEDLEAIEKEMKKIVKENLPFKAFILPREEAKKLMAERNENYKLEHIDDLADETEFSFFQQGEYIDMCLGPHICYTKALTRINGVAFRTQQELDEYLVMLEEAKKRDHRRLGKELGLFAFRDEAPGFPFYLPNGMVLRNTLIDYWREVHRKWDYVEIMTPQIMRRTLWETSGHWDHYKDNMYTTVIDGEDFAIKPMNCPGTILVYDLEPHSYRDLPMRCAELGNVHRHELSGALHGMFRVRAFTQDDAHILLAKEQIKDEVVRIAQLFDEVYDLFGLPYTIELSTMPEDHIGSVEDWDVATAALADAITSIGKEYIVNPGDGAFYGPKLDFHIQDSLGRTWQCGTIQLDYQLPGRFNLTYVGADGEDHVPVMIHRVVFGSIERFIGVITEHFAGAFPTWLSPVQVKVMPITDRTADYAGQVCEKLNALGVRAETDLRNEKIGYKIREAQMQKIPYMLVVGDREAEAGKVAVRTRKGEDLGAMDFDEFSAKILEEIKTRAK